MTKSDPDILSMRSKHLKIPGVCSYANGGCPAKITKRIGVHSVLKKPLDT